MEANSTPWFESPSLSLLLATKWREIFLIDCNNPPHHRLGPRPQAQAVSHPRAVSFIHWWLVSLVGFAVIAELLIWCLFLNLERSWTFWFHCSVLPFCQYLNLTSPHCSSVDTRAINQSSSAWITWFQFCHLYLRNLHYVLQAPCPHIHPTPPDLFHIQILAATLPRKANNATKNTLLIFHACKTLVKNPYYTQVSGTLTTTKVPWLRWTHTCE